METNVNNQNEKLFEILESCNCDSTGKEEKYAMEQSETTGTESIGERSNTNQGASSVNKFKKHCRSIKHITSLIPLEFVKKEKRATVYRLQHDVIQRMTLIVFGTSHFDKLLELSQPQDLKAYVREKESKLRNVRQGDINPVLEISPEQWKCYQTKLG